VLVNETKSVSPISQVLGLPPRRHAALLGVRMTGPSLALAGAEFAGPELGISAEQVEEANRSIVIMA
jgi:hypothetical protein